MPPESELGFPEFCCPSLAPRGANVTKRIVLLVPGGANMTKGVMTLIPEGADTAIVPKMFPLDDPEGGSVTNGAGVDVWTPPMEGLGTTGVLPGIIAIALAAAATEGLRMTMGVPPEVVTFALAAAAMAAVALLEGGGYIMTS